MILITSRFRLRTPEQVQEFIRLDEVAKEEAEQFPGFIRTVRAQEDELVFVTIQFWESAEAAKKYRFEARKHLSMMKKVEAWGAEMWIGRWTPQMIRGVWDGVAEPIRLNLA